MFNNCTFVANLLLLVIRMQTKIALETAPHSSTIKIYRTITFCYNNDNNNNDNSNNNNHINVMYSGGHIIKED